MDSEEGFGHRRNQSANNAIPLQNFSQDGHAQRAGSIARDESHRRTLSDRGRQLFNRGRDSTNQRRNTPYSPLGNTSQSPPAVDARVRPVAFVTTPSGQHERITDEDDETIDSPVVDRNAFQTAIGFAGLSFNVNVSSPDSDEARSPEETPFRPMHRSRATLDSLPRLHTPRSSMDMVSIQLDDGPAFLSPGVGEEDDTIPLNNLNPSQTSGQGILRTPPGQRHDRHKKSLSVRFSPNNRTSRSQSGSRLGDDLPGLEAGSLPSRSDQSISPTTRRMRALSTSAESPLHLTGTLLRKMSQRVVNLSNESDPVDRTMRRSSSIGRNTSREPSPSPGHDRLASFDGNDPPRSPAGEKMPPRVADSHIPEQLPVIDRNPLRGKSLGIFTSQSKIRRGLLSFLVHPFVEPFILILIIVQTVILAVDAARSVYDDPRPDTWGTQWTDYIILSIFCIYTVEIAIKIIVSGFIFNPVEYSTIDRSVGVRQALAKKANDLFTLTRKPSIGRNGQGVMRAEPPPSLLRSFTVPTFDNVPGGSRQAQKQRLAYRAFLRHSFNRLDFVAVLAFWIGFILGWTEIESKHKMYVFQMMSSLRILRLLGITNGTSVILRSLKRAASTLLNVAFLIGFFWLLFSIIGVQSFKSSLRRQCTWDGSNSNPISVSDNYTQNSPPPAGNFQFCGGWIAANGSQMPWLTADGAWGANKHKGYLCPVGSFCVQNDNPYNNTVSFDNILNSAEMVFVIMTSNTFTDIMYYLTDSDYLAAALFPACGIIILTFWLISLLIAVITSSFQVIREESRSSAFMVQDEPDDQMAEQDEKGGLPAAKQRVSTLKWAYLKSQWFWILVIVFGLVMQSLRTATMSQRTKTIISTSEMIVTFALLFEIIFRFVSDWRDFLRHYRNWFDLFLAIITSVMQLPVIHDSGTPYAWLTFFQIVRIYRVVLAVRLTRDLIMVVFHHISGVLNLIVFVFLLTFLAAIFASQLFRGQVPIIDTDGNYIQTTFATIFNSFLAMYQILSSENWTNVLYNVARFDYQYGTAWIAATFFIIWFILANFIVLNMFIAVIQESFDVSEDQKRMQQVRMFLQRKEFNSSSSSTLSLSTIFKFGKVKRQDPLDFGSAATEMLLKDAVVRDFLDEEMELDDMDTRRHTNTGFTMQSNPSNLGLAGPEVGWIKRIMDKVVKRLFHREPNPFYARLKLTKPWEELDTRALAKEVVSASEQRKVTQREYLRRHPTYNVSLYIFKPDNFIRRMCQRIVGPGRGDRIEGVQPNVPVWYTFSAFIYLAIVAMVLLACITTPLFQYQYFQSHPSTSYYFNWFTLTDLGFAALFTVEAVIKIIADGFYWTPNAYFHSSWGFIDGIVLITLWVNVFTSFYDPGSGSRAVGAFKALRALRLLNVSDSARDTFHSVIILGGWKVLSAAFVSLSLLIPFAIYGLNLFAGKMVWCSDWQQYDLYNLTDCVGEYTASPNGWDILSPRRAANNYFSFDSFGDSLFILFQIVSQEGWVDVMWSAQSITGVFTQPTWFASQGNAVYFVIFNLLGAVFVLTLFVSVFMRNYTEQTGVAFLTTDQRSWLELRKLLRQVAPSKRPNRQKERKTWQEWCYRRAVTKNGRWQRTMTGVLLAHLILLCLEWYPEPKAWEFTRQAIFFIFVLFYMVHIVVRIVGLSWTRFRRSAWDVYSIFSVFGTFVTSIITFIKMDSRILEQAHDLLLVSNALLLIPRNNQLDQLFKTAAASFSSIANLLATWFVLFLVYAIAFTQTFGLTRFGPNETNNLNFRSVPKALILLFKMSVGEGWNQIMIDYARIVPPYCTFSDRYFDGDCGSPQWAYALFITWNILSMYIFVNLFISLIYESFSYVYQRSTGLSVISREEIRRFKQAWAEYDPEGTGYISKEQFPRFLGELSGIFEMRIYDGDFSVRSLIEDCRVKSRTSALPVDGESANVQIDLKKLNARLADLPIDEVRRRRARMNTFYEEVLVSADPDRGVEFNTLLMILAHYKVIHDNKSLRLEEFLRRRARLQRVEEAVNRNIVVGFFDTLYWARRLRRHKERKLAGRMTMIPSFGVPEILVHDAASDNSSDVGDASVRNKAPVVPTLSVTPVDFDEDVENFSTEDLRPGRTSTTIPDFFDQGDAAGPGSSRASSEAGGPGTGTHSRSSSRGFHSDSIQATPLSSPTSRTFGGLSHRPPQLSLSPSARHRPTGSNSSIIQPDWHFAAAMEGAGSAGRSPPGSPGFPPADSDAAASRSRANSAVSQHEMMGLFQDSAWGQSLRRSFTQNRRDGNNPEDGVGGGNRGSGGSGGSGGRGTIGRSGSGGRGRRPSS